MLPLPLYRAIDQAMVTLTPGLRLFVDGFGDRRTLEALVERIRTVQVQTHSSALEVRWSGAPRHLGPVDIRHGHFHSPAAEWLPGAVQRGHLELLLPRRKRRRGPPQSAPVCLMLAGTGEEGYWMRRVLAAPLLRRGIGALLLENPFYGRRRAPGQDGPSLRTVEHQFAMNLAALEEARALLWWLRDQGHEHLGVTGYSQGGFMAGFAAALCGLPVAAILRSAGSAARPVFTEGALSRRIAWPRLGAEIGSEERARHYLEESLDAVQLVRFPPPRLPGAAILVNARGDGFVPAAEAESLHRHWSGSELRWLSASHATAALLHLRPQQQAVRDAFDRLRRAS